MCVRERGCGGRVVRVRERERERERESVCVCEKVRTRERRRMSVGQSLCACVQEVQEKACIILLERVYVFDRKRTKRQEGENDR